MALPARKLTGHRPMLTVHQRFNRYDPTRTTTLRNAFVREMAKRFNKLMKAIRTALVDEDCLGLIHPYGDVKRVKVMAEITTPGRSAFDFPRSSDKVAAFMDWLKKQADAGILEVETRQRLGTGIEDVWTNKYIKDTYQRGAARARYAMKNAGYEVPDLEATGGIAGMLATPPHVDRLGVVYTRVFSQLKGITDDMDNKLSQILAQSIADGEGPKVVARKLLAAIDGEGAGTLGITDTLGRFIPPKRRAMMLARTEIIRAHAQGQLQEAKNWGVIGVMVEAEFINAGFNVCPICEDLTGNRYTIEEAWNIIPVHPNCRCSWKFVPASEKESMEGPARIKKKRRTKEKTLDELIDEAVSPIPESALMPYYGRSPTEEEIAAIRETIKKTVDALPNEIKNWIKHPKKWEVGVIRLDGFVAREEGGVLWIRTSDLQFKSTMNHIVRHLFVNPEVIEGNGGADKMWAALAKENFRKPIHVNTMLQRAGTTSGLDEFLAVMGDAYRPGMTIAEQTKAVSELGGTSTRLAVEKVLNSGQVSYLGADTWVEREAKDAVLLWRKWMGLPIEAESTAAAFPTGVTTPELQSLWRKIDVTGKPEYIEEFGKLWMETNHPELLNDMKDLARQGTWGTDMHWVDMNNRFLREVFPSLEGFSVENNPVINTLKNLESLEPHMRARIQQSANLINRVLEGKYNINFTEVEIQEGVRAKAETAVGKIIIDKDESIPTIVHELGHLVEAKSHFMNYSARDWRDAKAVDRNLSRHLTELVPNGGYRPDEWARWDNFSHPYVGKVYSDNLTEVVSMWMSYLADYKEFGRLFREYPEEFYTMMGLFKVGIW